MREGTGLHTKRLGKKHMQIAWGYMHGRVGDGLFAKHVASNGSSISLSADGTRIACGAYGGNYARTLDRLHNNTRLVA